MLATPTSRALFVFYLLFGPVVLGCAYKMLKEETRQEQFYYDPWLVVNYPEFGSDLVRSKRDLMEGFGDEFKKYVERKGYQTCSIEFQIACLELAGPFGLKYYVYLPMKAGPDPFDLRGYLFPVVSADGKKVEDTPRFLQPAAGAGWAELHPKIAELQEETLSKRKARIYGFLGYFTVLLILSLAAPMLIFSLGRFVYRWIIGVQPATI